MRYRQLRLGTAAICGYESLSILLNHKRLPTLSTLASRHPWLAPSLIAALTVHLCMMPEVTLPPVT